MPDRFPTAAEFYPDANLATWGSLAVCLLLIVGGAARIVWQSRHPSLNARMWPWLAAIPLSLALGFGLVRLIDLWGWPAEWRPSRTYVWGCLFLLFGVLLGGAHVANRQRNGSRSPWLPVEALAVGLVGMLVVLGGLLLWPAPDGHAWARERSQCRNNLKQIGLAFHDDADLHESRLAPSAGESQNPPQSWRVRLLPFLDQRELHRRYEAGRNWDDPVNAPVARTLVPPFTCPAAARLRPVDGPYPFTGYTAVTGAHAALGEKKSRSLREISDGTSNTLLVVEACGLEIPWAEPRDFSLDRDPVGFNVKGTSRTHSPGLVSSYHSDGAHVLFADGAVRFLSENIDPQVLQAMATADGGETIDE